jgi:proteasome lid subunit RPN8/RPN11
MRDAVTKTERIEWQELQREVERAQLAVEDPELHELVQLALAPLDDVEDGPLFAAVRQPAPPFASLVVPERVINAIREHAATAPPKREVGGRLLVDRNGRATRYLPLENVEGHRLGRFDFRESWRRDPRVTNVVLHTHPSRSDAPSAADVAWANRYGFRVIAIYAVESDQLGVFRLAGNYMSRMNVNVELASMTAAVEPRAPLRMTVRPHKPRYGRFRLVNPRRPKQ